MSDEAGNEREELSADVRAALTPERVRVATRSRLLARAAADAAARGFTGGARDDAVSSSPGPVLAVSRGRQVPLPVFGVVALALAASLVFIVKLRNDSLAERTAFATADRAQVHRLDSLQTLVAARDQLVASLTGAQVRVVGLSAGETKSPRALMFWDKATDHWTFIAHNLAPLNAGRTYQLWLVTAGRKISAGTFSVSANGDAFVQATYPLDRNALKAVAVTEEPVGGVPVATGSIVVFGTVGTQ